MPQTYSRALCVAAAFGIAVAASPAHAQLERLVSECASPDSTPNEIVNFCQRALQSKKLPTRAEAQVRTNLGVGFFELGLYRDAVAEYDRAIAAAPDLASAYLNRARAQERLGNLQNAVEDYASVLRLEPDAADAYLGRGGMLLAHGDPVRAVGDFTQALRHAPDLTEAYFNRGIAHYDLGMWSEAAADFSAVINRNNRDAAAYLNRGQSRAASGDAGAQADYNSALSLAPEWSRAWFQRGLFFESQGQREPANSDFLRAYELGYEDPWLNERVRQISQ